MNENNEPSKPGSEKDAAADEHNGTGFFSVLSSVMAAGFGVQSRKNRERDFTQGKAIHFIVGGLIGTVVFIVAIVIVVKILLASV